MDIRNTKMIAWHGKIQKVCTCHIIMFKLLQEPMSFILVHQANMVDLCFYVNKSLSQIYSSYEAMVSLQKAGLNHSIHIDFFFLCLYELFEAQSFGGMDFK